ncbi:MAG: acetyl-CoA carboxylase carboxyltransferase subunit alpha [Bdellovibrionales bacterium GWB1_55_8]|nr:MAG: acetyl-CoA carboxylase carboxyltransferase subunit alpha [Bdellovibrionales bacterium GWB1_55_8]
MEPFLEFEKPIINLEKKLKDLKEIAGQEGVDFSKEITILEKKVLQLIDDTFAQLSPWQRVQLCRHPNRPYTRDYVDMLFPDFLELHGDRTFGDDRALLAGVATWPPAVPSTEPSPAKPLDSKRTPVLILGHQKGRTTKQKMERNFGMARPEGYRKAIRLMRMADRAQMPILAFIDTPGAYPGIEAEERGQAQAIAESIQTMFELSVPVVAVVIGEGGSGGALAIGVADVVLMQEYSTYSVISPESCASILWSNSGLAENAANRLKMSPPELQKLGVIDGIITEPKGGAHRDWLAACLLLREGLIKYTEPLIKAGRKSSKTRASERIQKFRGMGHQALAHAKLE